jgi:hypothetical protein
MRWLLLLLVAVGCEEPSYINGNLRCASGDQPCPKGYYCADDNTCWKNGDGPDLAVGDGGASADLLPVPCIGADGTQCPGGLCHGGMCDSLNCFIASVWYPSGAKNPANSCQSCVLSGDRMSWTTAAEGAQCTNGICHGGACCTGCWDGATCQAGTSSLACGKGANGCSDCRSLVGGSSGNCTNDPSCYSNMYQHYFVPVACNAGVCGYGAAACCANGCNGGGCL